MHPWQAESPWNRIRASFRNVKKSESQLSRSLSEISESAVDLSAISVERRFLFSLLVDQALGPVLTGVQA